MDDQKTDPKGSGLTIERLSRWFTVAGWGTMVAAIVFAAVCMPDDRSLYQFDSIFILIITLPFACAVHFVCMLIPALGREGEILAPRFALIFCIACVVGVWLYCLASMTMAGQGLWLR